MGHVVDVADNGIGALAALARVKYDAVLMDCQMPEMDGFEATRELRRREGSDRHTIVIAMTAGAMAGDQEKCLAAGMDAYLSKPVKADRLAAMIEHWTDPTEGRREQPGHAMQPSSGLLDQTYVTGLRELGTDEFDKLIRLFLKDGQTRIDGLRAAQTTGDTAAMVKLAHSLKGSASSFGAGTLAARCGELQARARAADAAEDARMIDSVDAEFVRASAALPRAELAPDPRDRVDHGDRLAAGRCAGSVEGVDGRAGSQGTQRRALGERGCDVLDLARRGGLAQAESLTQGDAARFHQVGDELVLDTFGNNQARH